MSQATAAARARDLLLEGGHRTIPVPIDKIARRLGASVSYEPFEKDVSGVAYRRGRDLLVGINSRHAATRQRFTLAHEIGHLVLHQGRPMTVDKDVRVNRRDRTSSLATDAEEIEANAFAAEILMPAQQLRDEVRSSLNEGASKGILVAQLAARFDVSKQAMRIRLSNLGIHAPDE